MRSPLNQNGRVTNKIKSKKRGTKRNYLVAAVASVAGIHSTLATFQLWDPLQTGATTGPSGGTGNWNTTSAFWDTGTTPSLWTNGSTSDASFQTSGGVVSITDAVNGVNMETGRFNASGYVIQGGPITLVGTTPGFTSGGTASATIVSTINSTLQGSLGAKFLGTSSQYSTMNISGSSTYTGLTQIEQLTLNYGVLANGGSPSSFGAGTAGSAGTGIVDVGVASSAVLINYVGTATGQTDRLWQDTGTSTTIDINNNSAFPISFNATGAAVAGTAGVRGFIFGGSSASTVVNTFAEAIGDLGTGTSVTKVNISGGTWVLSGSSTYSNGTGISGGILQVGSAENAGVSGPLGIGGAINFSGGSIAGTLQYSSVNSFDYSARIALGTSTKAVSIDTNGDNVTFATALTASQSGGLAKLGLGTLTLSAANAYTGNTNISNGILQVNAAETPGTSGPLGKSGNINFSGGTLQYSSNNNFDYSSRIAAGTSSKAVSIDTNGQNVTFATGLTALQTGGLSKLGLGTLTLSAADAYTGATNISAGTLAITNAAALPSTSVVAFSNNTGPATLDITGQNQTVAGLVFGQQQGSSGTNNIIIQGNAATSLTSSPATENFAPFNASGNLLVDMSSIGSYTYSNSAGNFNVSMGVNAGANGSTAVKLASLNDSITALAISVGNIGSQTFGTGSQSTLILGNNATLTTNTLNVGTSKSRAGGTLNAGSGTLTIAGLSGGLTNLNIGQNDSNTFPVVDVITSVLDTSAGTLAASLGNIIIGQSSPNLETSGNRYIGINAGLKMGAGTLTANSLSIGQLNDLAGQDNTTSAYQYEVNGSFNLAGGTATIPTITLGTSSFSGNINFNASSASYIDAVITLDSGATLNTTSISSPGIVIAYNNPSGLLTINPAINWDSGTINNIAGANLNISSTLITLTGATATHDLNISAGQTATIGVVNGSGGIVGTGGLLKMGTGALSLYLSNSYSGGTNISNGTASLYNTHALPAFGNLSIGSTAKLTATTLGNAYAAQIGSLTVAPGGIIDLQNNAATIRGSTIGTVFGLVQSGFNGSGGAWTGTGITSSTAAAGTLNALGVIINDTGANTGVATGTPLYNTSSGASTADGDILVKYTYYGDANLDGKVDASDYSLIDSGYASNGADTGWYNGDFNYDGVINGSDYTLIDNAFNTQGGQISDEIATPTAEIAGSASVPEPTTLSLFCLGTAGLLSRRRQQL